MFEDYFVATITDVTPSDSTNLAEATKYIMVTVGGDVSLLMENGSTGILSSLLPGVMYPVRCVRVNSTSTTATGIKALS